jgi:DNA-binding transcriptional regulator YiaG
MAKREKKKPRDPRAMDAAEYVQLREKLGLSNYALAPILGISVRQAQRYESGETAIDLTVALLLRCYVKHGLPKG